MSTVSTPVPFFTVASKLTSSEFASGLMHWAKAALAAFPERPVDHLAVARSEMEAYSALVRKVEKMDSDWLKMTKETEKNVKITLEMFKEQRKTLSHALTVSGK